MKKLLSIVTVLFLTSAVWAQEKEPFLTHMFLPVDAGATFSSASGVGAGFYMRACLEYRFNTARGLFIAGEIDTYTNPYDNTSISDGNVTAGDAAFNDILIGPGYRVAVTDKFKLAFSAQAGAANMGIKEVGVSSAPGKFVLTPRSQWVPCLKAGVMVEFFLTEVFDIYLSIGVPMTLTPLEISKYRNPVLFPTVSAGFSLPLQ